MKRARTHSSDLERGVIAIGRRSVVQEELSVGRAECPDRDGLTIRYAFTPGQRDRERRMQSLLEVAQLWITREGLILLDIEYIVDKAGKLLYKDRLALKNIPISLRSPSETDCLGATRKGRKMM
jgi:hypothetical protein